MTPAEEIKILRDKIDALNFVLNTVRLPLKIDPALRNDDVPAMVEALNTALGFPTHAIEMNDDTASYIAGCYADSHKDFCDASEIYIVQLTILRTAVSMGWIITENDIQRALQYCADHPLGSASKSHG